MKQLNKTRFKEVANFIKNNARKLDIAIFDYHFNGSSGNEIINALSDYQNSDGGFGHALESDIRLPNSSPVCTDRAMRLLTKLEHLDQAQVMIHEAIGYYEQTYSRERNGWFIVGKEVNDYPHAPWWHYDETQKMTIIDQNWGNSSAEIISYLYKYQTYVKTLDVNSLVDYAIQYFNKKAEYNSENEIYCYLYLYHVLPRTKQILLNDSIKNAINHVIEPNESNYHKYVPTPLDFVPHPCCRKFGISEESLTKNLEFIISQLDTHASIRPPWDKDGKTFYTNEMRSAYKEWHGAITLERLLLLKNYGRIDLK